MIKVTLLGDSIRLLGYGKKVPSLLGDGYEVFQPDDNCRFAKYTLRCLFDYKNDIEGSDIIHWNNGLWDVCEFFDDGIFSSLEEYVSEMLRLAGLLKSRAKAVIFATTTPVGPKFDFIRNEMVDRYNEALVPELEKLGITINDLCTTVTADIDRYIGEDQIHLSDIGVDVCAKQVADIIRKTADELHLS